MAKLYPYYVHSDIENFKMQGMNLHTVAKVEVAINRITAKLLKQQEKLLAQENNFYASIGITSRDDDGFSTFIKQMYEYRDSMKNATDAILWQLTDYINTNDDFYKNIEKDCKAEVERLIKNENMIKEDALQKGIRTIIKNRLSTYCLKYSADTRQIALGVIDKVLGNTQVEFKSSEYRNVRGGVGELFTGHNLLDVAINIAKKNGIEDQIINVMTGQQTNIKGQDVSSDMMILIGNSLDNIISQTSWQIKNYKLTVGEKGNERIKKNLRLGGFEDAKWDSIGKSLSEEKFLSKEQYKWLTYAIANYTWFSKVGTIVKTNGRLNKGSGKVKIARATHKQMGESLSSIIEDMRRIIAALSVKKMIQGLDDFNNLHVGSDGIVTLQKADGTQTKVVNIPPIFWVISNSKFFPTRWIIRDLLAWLQDLKTQTFTPLYASIKIEQSFTDTASASEFWYRKKIAAGGRLIRNGGYTNAGLLAVGKAQGQDIIDAITITQKVSVILSQLDAIFGGFK